jgi:bifunctional pyridoxal-dependent enzyme with beta-cystathionase and maltose regulon repressor activities
VAAVLTVEKYTLGIDQNREAWVFLVTSPSRAFRALGFLVAVSLVPNSDSKVREDFIRRHIAGLNPGGLPRSVSHLAWLSTHVRHAASQSANWLPFAPWWFLNASNIV